MSTDAPSHDIVFIHGMWIKKQAKAPSATEHKEYPGRYHFPGQDGWEAVADYILDWTTSHARQPSAA
jgi:hypothetical protein